MLNTALEKLTYIIVKAREYDVQVAPDRLEEGSDSPDDKEVGILESTADNPTGQELKAALENLNIDEKAELLALVWLGRGDFTKDEWKENLKRAQQEVNDKTVQYLMGTPLLGDLIEEGLSELGYNITEYEKNRL